MDFNSLFNSTVAETLSLKNVLIILAGSLILGLLVSLVYIVTHKKDGYSQSFTTCLIMLSPIVSLVILLIGNSVARAFSLAGAFALIRFRSAPGDPKDIAYVFFTVVIGLACGMGYVGYAVVFTVILCLVMLILHFTKFGLSKKENNYLKIIIPESLNYVGVFNDIFKQYTTDTKVIRIKTVDFGALFEITYDITLKKDVDTKEFIDALRCRNGNLKITLSVAETVGKEYHF